MNLLKRVRRIQDREIATTQTTQNLGPLYLTVLVDDLSDEAGVRLPRLTPEMFSRYNDRQSWVQAVIRAIRESDPECKGKLNECC